MDEPDNQVQGIQLQVAPPELAKMFVVILGANVTAFCAVNAFVEHRKKRQLLKGIKDVRKSFGIDQEDD